MFCAAPLPIFVCTQRFSVKRKWFVAVALRQKKSFTKWKVNPKNLHFQWLRRRSSDTKAKKKLNWFLSSHWRFKWIIFTIFHWPFGLVSFEREFPFRSHFNWIPQNGHCICHFCCVHVYICIGLHHMGWELRLRSYCYRDMQKLSHLLLLQLLLMSEFNLLLFILHLIRFVDHCNEIKSERMRQNQKQRETNAFVHHLMPKKTATMDLHWHNTTQTDRPANKKTTNFARSNFVVATAFIWLGKCTGFVFVDLLLLLLFDLHGAVLLTVRCSPNENFYLFIYLF